MNNFQIEYMGLWINAFRKLKVDNLGDFFVELMELEEQINDRIPFISNHGFVQLSVLIECITLFKVIHDKLNTINLLTMNQKKSLLGIFARIINERFRYFDLNLINKDLKKWHAFIDKHNLYYGNADDTNFDLLNTNVFLFLDTYIKYGMYDNISIHVTSFGSDIIHLFTWGILEYKYDFDLYRIINDIIENNLNLQYLKSYWPRN